MDIKEGTCRAPGCGATRDHATSSRDDLSSTNNLKNKKLVYVGSIHIVAIEDTVRGL
jgi:hypothetical protein